MLHVYFTRHNFGWFLNFCQIRLVTSSWNGRKKKETVSPEIPQLKTTGLGQSDNFRQNVCSDLSDVEYFYFKYFMFEAMHKTPPEKLAILKSTWVAREIFLRVEGDGEACAAGDRTTRCVTHKRGSRAKTVMSELFAQHRQIGSCASNLLGQRRGSMTEFPLIEGRKQIKVF